MAVFKEIGDFCEENRADERDGAGHQGDKKGLNDLQAATMWFMQNAMAKPTMPAPVPPITSICSAWLCSASCGAKAPRRRMKARCRRTAALIPQQQTGDRQFYMDRMMPETGLRKARIETGPIGVMALAARRFDLRSARRSIYWYNFLRRQQWQRHRLETVGGS